MLLQRVCALTATAMFVALLSFAGSPQQADAAGAVACTTPNPGEVTVYWFDVEQGDGQLIIGPSGKTLLVDLGETAWNSKGANTKAARIEATLRSICGTGTSPVALDYVMGSHHHLDHIGYAWNPQDAVGAVGNGLYQLLTPASLGGFGFTAGMLIDRDGGTWTDANGDGICTVGTSAAPSNEIAWHNAGTLSQTSRRWICWLYGPVGQADRANIEGKVFTLTNTNVWPAIDLGTGVATAILNANGKDTMLADGVTPVSGDHTADATPPSENDYSIAIKVTYGNWEYATAGDSDGEYATSSFGYTYNDIEAKLGPLYGNLETYRLNHHGSGRSSNQTFIDTLRPESVLISCGANSYGHPNNRITDALRVLANEKGTGTDMYITNNPCDPKQPDGTTDTNYAGILNTNGDIRLVTTGAGAGYVIFYDVGNRTYVAYDESAIPDPSKVVINEYLMAPDPTANGEWVELYNPTATNIDLSGLYIDDLAAGGGAPKQIPAGTIIPAKGYWVMSFASGFLNNTGSESVRYLKIVDGVETVYDATSYSLASTEANKVFHRTGDGGAWCTTISTNVTKGTANPATCDAPAPAPAPAPSTADPSKVVINEYLMAPDPSTNGEWVELYNPTDVDVDLSGLYVDDLAAGGGAPKQIPAGTIIPAKGFWVMSFASGFLNNTGAESVRYLKIVDGVETVYDSTSYDLGSSQYNKVFHRTADGGAWCSTISTNVTKGTANPATCP